ncbi:PPM1B phosphatase, partial [Polyodon spathula]|nr:PPM1B phosphatase [Polyodon spathula]
MTLERLRVREAKPERTVSPLRRSVIEAVYSRLNPHRDEDGDPPEAEDGWTKGKLRAAFREFRVNRRGNYGPAVQEEPSNVRLAGEQRAAQEASAAPSAPARNPQENTASQP